MGSSLGTGRRRRWARVVALLTALLVGCAPGAAGPVRVEGTTLDGAALDTDALDGPLVLNFWASWCGPCRREAPELNAVADAYAAHGVHVVGVNARDTATNARAFADDHGLAFPSVLDTDQRITSGLGGDAPVALPTTLVLDRAHRVVARLPGEVDRSRLADVLDELVGGGTS